MRAGDRDRDAVVDVLHQAHAEGRLGYDELNDRLERALTAQTYGELVPLTSDLPTCPDTGRLPAVPSAVGARAAGPGVPRPSPRVVNRALKAAWFTWALAVSINLVIWVLVSLLGDGGAPPFWPIWVAGPWGAVLLVSTVAARRGSD